MWIKNAMVFTEEAGFQKKDFYISGEYFSDAAVQGDTVLDAEGLYAIPGLTDLHFHGCVGFDFCDGTDEAIAKMARYELLAGVTTICPATMTLSEEELLSICKTAAAYHPAGQEAELVGINMEGPFLSLEKKGAQNPAYLHKPDAGMFRRLQTAAGGLVKLLAVAPEEEGAMQLIQEVQDEVSVSVAHTTADYDTAMKAFAVGARQATHLYNAMPPLSHRAPGVIGAAMDAGAMVELICDGVHVHPSVIRATFRMFGAERIILISDSMMATGMPDGAYSLGGQAVTVKGNLATLTEGGAIAGSATNLMDCLRFAVKEAGIPLADAVRCAAVNPAKEIGIYDRYGSITPGKVANLVLLDQGLALKQVFLKGCAVL